MKHNIGNADRIVRIFVTFAILGMVLTDLISGTTAIILGAVAVILALTSALGFCPLYLPFNISTKKSAKVA